MLAVGFSQMSFIRGRKIPSISSFMRVFIMNGFWILSRGRFFINDHVIFFPLCSVNVVKFSCSVMSDSLEPHGVQHIHQASLSIINSWSLFKLMFFELVMPSNHLILCPLLFLLQSFPASGSLPMNQFFIRWTKYWSFSFSISPSNEYSGLISLGWTGWISLLSKGPSRVFFNFSTLQKHQFSHTQLSL